MPITKDQKSIVNMLINKSTADIGISHTLYADFLIFKGLLISLLNSDNDEELFALCSIVVDLNRASRGLNASITRDDYIIITKDAVNTRELLIKISSSPKIGTKKALPSYSRFCTIMKVEIHTSCFSTFQTGEVTWTARLTTNRLNTGGAVASAHGLSCNKENLVQLQPLATANEHLENTVVWIAKQDEIENLVESNKRIYDGNPDEFVKDLKRLYAMPHYKGDIGYSGKYVIVYYEPELNPRVEYAVPNTTCANYTWSNKSSKNRYCSHLRTPEFGFTLCVDKVKDNDDAEMGAEEGVHLNIRLEEKDYFHKILDGYTEGFTNHGLPQLLFAAIERLKYILKIT